MYMDMHREMKEERVNDLKQRRISTHFADLGLVNHSHLFSKIRYHER